MRWTHGLIVAVVAVVLLAVTSCAHNPQMRDSSEKLGGLALNCNVCDAILVIDGMEAGLTEQFSNTVDAYPLQAGRSYQVVIKKDGYDSFSRKVFINGDVVTLNVTLKRK